MWHRVAAVLTDVSEERRCHIPEDCFLHSHRRENLKSYKHRDIKSERVILDLDWKLERDFSNGWVQYGTRLFICSFGQVVCSDQRVLPIPHVTLRRGRYLGLPTGSVGPGTRIRQGCHYLKLYCFLSTDLVRTAVYVIAVHVNSFLKPMTFIKTCILVQGGRVSIKNGKYRTS
jgi:hypothetical protein